MYLDLSLHDVEYKKETNPSKLMEKDQQHLTGQWKYLISEAATMQDRNF